jgi:hypothetical protein
LSEKPHRPGIAPALGLRAGCVVDLIVAQTTAMKSYKGVAMPLLGVEVPRENIEADATPPQQNGVPPAREIRHEYTHSLPPLLSQLGVSLLVSTYQAGKVVAVVGAAGELVGDRETIRPCEACPPRLGLNPNQSSLATSEKASNRFARRQWLPTEEMKRYGVMIAHGVLLSIAIWLVHDVITRPKTSHCPICNSWVWSDMIAQHKEYCINSFHGKLWLNRDGNSTTPVQSDEVPTKQTGPVIVSSETAPGALRCTPGDAESQEIADRFSCPSTGSPIPAAVTGQQTN